MQSAAGWVASADSSWLRNWWDVMRSGGLPEGRRVDPVSRWLILTRASVLPMTLTSALIGGLLAAGHPAADWRWFSISLFGLLVAHACNNLMNDYFDYRGGVDQADSPRALYAPHPVLAGWITPAGLLRAMVVLNLVGLAVLVFLASVRGWPVVAFALAGFAISFFYVAPPIRLKHRGLGEPGVAIVWGPLMIGGTYYVTTASLPAWVWAASLPYAVLVTAVLVGKHLDKLEHDRRRGVRTLPVLLGEEGSIRLNQALMVGFYGLVAALVLAGVLGAGVLLVFASLPLLRRVVRLYSDPRPEEPPPRYPVWPLWYVAAAFVLTRQAGALFVVGLALNHGLGWG